MKKEIKQQQKLEKKQQRKQKNRVKPGRLARREALVGLAFVSPWILGALVFLAYPLCASFYYSLFNIRITPLGMKFTFVGQGNFTQILLSDQSFPTQIIEYLVSTVISVPIIVSFALIIALMLNGNIKGKGFFRLIFFLPVIIVSGPILTTLTDQGAGTITAIDTQAITSAIGSFLPAALADPIESLFNNMITILWYSGVQILIFLSSLQKVDRSMYEAAKIDGASGWECFWKITLPTVKPMILLNCIYTIVFISNNDQNAIIGLIKSAMFSGTSEKGYGYASAMAWVYSMIVVVLVVLFALLLMAKKDVYARQVKKAKKEMKKEQRERRKIERRTIRYEKHMEKERNSKHHKTYDGSGDY